MRKLRFLRTFLWVLLSAPLLWSCRETSPAGPPSDPLGGLIYAISESKEVPSQAEWDEVETAKIIFSALRPSAYATVELLHVTTGGDDTHDGTSWDKAKKTIQSALDAVTDASKFKVYLVLIGAGTYTPKATLSMKNCVAIIGGFEASGSYEKGDESTISGSGARGVFRNTYLDTYIERRTVPSTAVLARVTVTQGFSTEGGGMYNSNSSPTLTQVMFSGNTATEHGGGIYNSNSYLTLTAVTFSGNSAGKNGGGMANDRSLLILTAVTFSDNTATDHGGGMYNISLWSPTTLTAITFSGNSASKNGGGMANDSSRPILVAVTFSNNSAVEGGGMYNSNSSPTIAGAIFWSNTKGAANTPDQVVNVGNSTPIIAHSIVQGGYTGGTEILTTDPLLSSALKSNGGFVQTQAIRAGSPAINTGLYFVRSEGLTNYYSADNTTWYATPLLIGTAVTLPAYATKYTTDARGYSYSGRPDMGAYESGGTAPATP